MIGSAPERHNATILFSNLVWEICGQLAGSALRFAEESVEFAARRIEGVLLFFRAVVDQWAAVGMNRLAKKSLRSDFSQ